MDLLNDNTRQVRHIIGDHTHCGHSCPKQGLDLRKKAVFYEALVAEHGDPTKVDLRVSRDGLLELNRNQMIEEIIWEGRARLTKKQLCKLSTVQLRKKVAKIWGLDPSEVAQ